MSKRVLVTYATRSGSTAAVAGALARGLAASGAQVDVRPIRDVTSPEGYDAVIVGSPIHAGAWLSDAIGFVVTHRRLLGQIPTAYFVTCRTLRQDTPAQREIVRHYLDPLLSQVPEVTPRAIGYFAGTAAQEDSPLWRRLLARLIGTQGAGSGDQAIRRWAESVRRQLSA